LIFNALAIFAKRRLSLGARASVSSKSQPGWMNNFLSIFLIFFLATIDFYQKID
jgi:hypothetical protein